MLFSIPSGPSIRGVKTRRFLRVIATPVVELGGAGLSVSGRTLHVVECGTVFQRRRYKGSAHGMRRIAAVALSLRRVCAAPGRWRRGPYTAEVPVPSGCDLAGETSVRLDRRHGRQSRDRRGCFARHSGGWQAHHGPPFHDAQGVEAPVLMQVFHRERGDFRAARFAPYGALLETAIAITPGPAVAGRM